MLNSLFKHTETSDEYTFFYRDKILFKGHRNAPFLYLRLQKEGVRKLLPFNEFEITKEEENLIDISFFATTCVIKLRLTCDEKCVYFSFKKLGKRDDRLYIRLYKKDTRTVGLGLNEENDFDKINIGVFDKIKAKKNDKVYINLDNTLNFYVINSYYFSNENINDWQLEINSSIIVSSKQETIKFRLEFNKRFSFLPQKNYKILKTTLSEQMENLDSEYDGYIIDYENEIRTVYNISKIRKQNKAVFTRISPLLDEKSAENYNKETLLKVDGGYIVDITDEKNYRRFGNYLRDVFNQNPDGIYVDEYKIKVDEKLYFKNILFYENLYNLISEIKKEYPEKYIIFNKLNSSDKILKSDEDENGDKVNSLFLSYKTDIKIQKELYSINYDDIKKKENIFINSLLFSGYRAYFYECNESDVEKLVSQGKVQLIVDRSFFTQKK